MTAVFNFTSLGEKMCQLLDKKGKERNKQKKVKEKTKVIDHMFGQKGAKFSRCVAVFLGASSVIGQGNYFGFGF